MHHGRGWSRAAACFIAVAGFTACGGGDADSSAEDDAGAAAGDRLGVCDLLADAEVAEVLPGHDGGIVTADGGSLIEGVDTYQCSWTARGEAPADFDLLTVTVTIASTPELFDEVRPAAGVRRDVHDDFGEIDAGDGGFTYGEPDDRMVDVWQDATLVSLELVSDEAGTHADRLISLATTALANALR
jgi:hypothetical protein